jgi:cytochrome c553
MKQTRCLVAPLLLAFIGCTPSPKGVPGVNLGAPELAWSAKNHEQRFGHMAAQVQPQMHALFKKYDASYAETFTCQTCHGDNAELVDWKMPNPSLYALPTEDTLQSSMEYDEKVTSFMMEVTPAMKKLLNTGAGDPVAVSCFTCHPVE